MRLRKWTRRGGGGARDGLIAHALFANIDLEALDRRVGHANYCLVAVNVAALSCTFPEEGRSGRAV